MLNWKTNEGTEMTPFDKLLGGDEREKAYFRHRRDHPDLMSGIYETASLKKERCSALFYFLGLILIIIYLKMTLINGIAFG